MRECEKAGSSDSCCGLDVVEVERKPCVEISSDSECGTPRGLPPAPNWVRSSPAFVCCDLRRVDHQQFVDHTGVGEHLGGVLAHTGEFRGLGWHGPTSLATSASLVVRFCHEH